MAIEQFLVRRHINFTRVTHPPFLSCDDANEQLPNLPGARTKNLFIVDKKQQRYFLLVLADHKTLDWSELGKLIGGRLQLASEDQVKEVLKLEPGAVSLLALRNDPGHRITLLVDEDVWSQDAIQCHPLVNTATLVISKSGINKFLSHTGHKPAVITVPERARKPELA
ncbi:prolyl-tRNA synthetase associated domain-containing protein [Endozoicomonas sp. ONNA2]|uniref:prolyl-tRNA synthetase associated domain-containing protein n=1 Tax=Endozoicomonas sp. ONNA2 TaxID=2828741 RepID=UPI002148AB12|nr:prolyl-tRNA synthetase associated domain-containing protein [Endozoicomonas sp. ONNA2]